MSTWDRPVSPAMRPENAKLYDDPPADIAREFGLRPFFDATGAHTPFRVGLFHGVGWMLNPYHHLADGTNMVHITKRRDASNVYDLQFCHCEMGPDTQDRPEYAVRSAYALPLSGLVAKYAEVLGADAVL